MKASLLGVVLAFGLGFAEAHAQGCAQCRSGVEQGSKQTQSAYRHGIAALCLAGTGVSLAGFFVVRRFR